MTEQNRPRARFLLLLGLCGLLAICAHGIARVLVALIALITQISFYGTLSASPSSPGDAHLGWFVLFVPVIGGLIVGFMARYGSKAIRGHGIPEAMEQILTNQSRIPFRLIWLKPISAAIAIGTGGPFGAEGPIIATGGALGSFFGQIMKTTPVERKTLLSAGAAAGMTAIFGTPFSAVLLAIELLLFEFRARSFVPVAFATAVAATLRISATGNASVFDMIQVTDPTLSALGFFLVEGVIIGALSVAITRVVYWIEDAFEELPIHWMWWPALGGLAVGAVGYFYPDTLGVGYRNIDHILLGTLAGKAMLLLCAAKFVSWSISLASGTSGGTLAPLFTIGGGLGGGLALLANRFFPGLGLSPELAALVGMASVFAGASRAMLASALFAFEATRQTATLLPLLEGCTLSHLTSSFLMANTIMSEKIVRRGLSVPADYGVDPLELVNAGSIAHQPVVNLSGSTPLQEARNWLLSNASGSRHGGYPVIDEPSGALIGVLSRKRIMEAPLTAETAHRPLSDWVERPAIFVTASQTAREALELMARHSIGRLPVLEPRAGGGLLGIITRSDLLAAHGRHLQAEMQLDRTDFSSLPVFGAIARIPKRTAT